MLKDETATAALGRAIARGLQRGDAVLLSGGLGAGKTTLARAVLRALGVDEHVPSPSFTLVQSYETPALTARHFDLYRIENLGEIAELGLKEALEDGAVLLEWPERAQAMMPEEALTVALAITGEQTRSARIDGPERWRAFLETAGGA